MISSGTIFGEILERRRYLSLFLKGHSLLDLSFTVYHFSIVPKKLLKFWICRIFFYNWRSVVEKISFIRPYQPKNIILLQSVRLFASWLSFDFFVFKISFLLLEEKFKKMRRALIGRALSGESSTPIERKSYEHVVIRRIKHSEKSKWKQRKSNFYAKICFPISPIFYLVQEPFPPESGDRDSGHFKNLKFNSIT